MFASYAPITNKVHDADLYAAPPGCLWAATHKIDGTNVSVIIPKDGKVVYGRRNGLLKMSDDFYGFQEVLPKVIADWRELLLDFPDASQVTVYGELYGSGAPVNPAHVSKKTGKVQRSITYLTPKGKRAFIAFDISVDGAYIDYPKAVEVFRRRGIPHTPVVFSGTVVDVVAWARAHASDVVDPAWYGVTGVVGRPPADKGEGWVVRPFAESINPYGERVIIKVKNPAFSESVPAGKPAGKSAPPSPVASHCPVTLARVANVLSKELLTDLTLQNVGMLADKVIADFQKDTPSYAPDDKTKKALRRDVSTLVRTWMLDR